MFWDGEGRKERLQKWSRWAVIDIDETRVDPSQESRVCPFAPITQVARASLHHFTNHRFRSRAHDVINTCIVPSIPNRSCSVVRKAVLFQWSLRVIVPLERPRTNITTLRMTCHPSDRPNQQLRSLLSLIACIALLNFNGFYTHSGQLQGAPRVDAASESIIVANTCMVYS